MDLFNPKKFVDYKFESNFSVLYYRWKEETANMNEEDYKFTMAFLLNEVKEHKIQYIIANQLDKKFTIGISIQDWVANVIKVGSEFGVKKIAIIESKEFVAQLSLEQLVEESKKIQDKSSMLFFKTEKEAYKWILDKS